MTITEAYTILGLTPPADQQTVKSAWRRLISQYHPDRPETGDRSKFDAVQAAYELLAREPAWVRTVRAWQSETPPPRTTAESTSTTVCSMCNGTGYISRAVHIGLTSTTTIMLCPTCHGRSARQACSACFGKGYTEYRTGFMTIKIACPACQ